MTEAKCRYNPETNTYTTPTGDTCDTPRNHHCQARKTCPIHLAWGEQTCPRCLARTRQDITHITARAADMYPEALVSGVNSEAANLAGPACDVEAWSWRKVASKQGRAWHFSSEEDDDERHPFTVLTYWAWMTALAYSLPEPDVWTIANAAALLDTQLHRIAQDPDQDFPQMARELRKCRAHLEAVLSDSMAPEKGAPCPDCRADGTLVRLTREYGHWCDNPECRREHHADDTDDRWVCPRYPEQHQWTPKAYSNYLQDRMGA